MGNQYVFLVGKSAAETIVSLAPNWLRFPFPIIQFWVGKALILMFGECLDNRISSDNFRYAFVFVP